MPYRSLAPIIGTIPATVVLVSAGAVAWLRRKTWNCACDRPITVAMTLLVVTFGLTVPIQHLYLGKWIAHLLGVAYLRDVLGHLLLLVSIGFLIYAAICRILSDAAINRFMQMWVAAPIVLAWAGMVISFVESGYFRRCHQCWTDLQDIPTGPWLKTYWSIFSVTCGYLLLLLIRTMVILRRDPRSRRIANVFIAGAVVGLVTSVAWVLNSWDLVPNETAWVLEVIMAGFWVIAAFMSVRAHKHLVDVTHITPSISK